MTITDVLISLAILGVVLVSDLGTRKLTARRMRRPILIGGVVIALFLPSIPTAGGDLLWEVIAATIGASLGLLSLVTIRVAARPGTGEVVTEAGLAYALMWIVSIGGRLFLGFAMQNIFPHATYSFMVSQHLTGGDAIRAMFICMILGEVAVRTTTIAVRATRLNRSGGLRPEAVPSVAA